MQYDFNILSTFKPIPRKNTLKETKNLQESKTSEKLHNATSKKRLVVKLRPLKLNILTMPRTPN